MSILADIYLAHDADAAQYDRAPEQFAERGQYRGFTPLEFSLLWAALQGLEWDEEMLDGFACVYEDEGGQRLVHRFPAEMVADLAVLADDAILEVATVWTKEEELSCTPAEIVPVIRDLVRLARRAEATGCKLYLWNSP